MSGKATAVNLPQLRAAYALFSDNGHGAAFALAFGHGGGKVDLHVREGCADGVIAGAQHVAAEAVNGLVVHAQLL